MTSIGIRREDKHAWEARVPLTPSGVAALVAQGVDVVVQPSTIRAYADDAYRSAGARIEEDLSSANALFAVKEIPVGLLKTGGVYVFFSHTIKGQAANMPMLRRMMELGCTLIDYEKIVDADGRRLVFFGRHAGLAGMIDTLHVLGQRLLVRGHDTALSALKMAHGYEDLDAARADVQAIGARLSIPAAIAPLIVGFAGYGNVSQGAQAIFDLLPHVAVEPAALGDLGALPRDRLVKVVFREEHLVERSDGAPFVLDDYYQHPERYHSVFERHLDKLSVLVNAIFWTDQYPRLVRKAHLRDAHASMRLLAIGDISCDIEGSVECTLKATTPGAPAYVYHPESGAISDGIAGDGVVMMTTDCLPCELPRESSQAFTDALAPFVPPIAALVPSGAFEDATLPPEIAKATILWRGALTPDFAYLQRFV
jgi:alpha-aminoadipic semialdehyde synthase